jgi:rhodanese-related sulfurtransferase
MRVARGADYKLSIKEARLEIAGGQAQPIDVRDEEAWGEAHVHGAIHIPMERLSEVEGLEDGQRVIVFAGDDKSAREAVGTLCDKGLDAVAAEGGIDAWLREDFRAQPTTDPDSDTELGAG